MISNSVTHLRSYANSAIADIGENSAPISPLTPRDRRHHRADRRHRRAERRRLRIRRRRPRIERWYRRIEWRVFKCFVMFHNVLSVSWCFTSSSRCITMFYMCFMMFYMCFMMFTCVSWYFTMFNNVLWCLVSRATIGDRAGAPIASGIAPTPQE